MPPKTRGKRAAAAPPDDSDPPAAKKAKGKGKGKVKAEPIEDDHAAVSEPEQQPPKNEIVKEAQLASRTTQVPLDEGCTLTMYRVYIDDSGLIYDAALNQTNAGNNNNKFYRIQVSTEPSNIVSFHLHVYHSFFRMATSSTPGHAGDVLVRGDKMLSSAVRIFSRLSFTSKRSSRTSPA